MILEFNNRNSGHEFQSNDNSPDIGPKIALWGSVLSAVGDILAVVGGAIAIEESNIADKQQQQTLEKLQSQIDDLQKAQSQNDVMSIDIDMFNNLLDRMIDRLEQVDNPKGKNNRT